MVKTGIVVDIQGRGPPVSDDLKVIAFRADMDALVMAEKNPGLPYKSTTNAAHMCFHDGHIVVWLGGIAKLLGHINGLPCNHIARFIFQPAEEKFGGARVMIEEGCLDKIEEIWGLHFYPYNPIDTIYVISGVSNSGTRAYKITVHGKEGHSSCKSSLLNPVTALCDFNLSFERLLKTRIRGGK